MMDDFVDKRIAEFEKPYFINYNSIAHPLHRLLPQLSDCLAGHRLQLMYKRRRIFTVALSFFAESEH